MIPRAGSVGEETFALQCRAYGLDPVREWRFSESRRWRVDFAFIPEKLAIEIEGGVWSGGRHSRGGLGFIADIEKYNHLTKMGYRLLRYTTEMVESGAAIQDVRSLLG